MRRVNNVNGFTLRYFLRFYWKSGEGNGFFDRARWFDLLMGTDTVRKAILAGKDEAAIRAGWKEELQKYKEMQKKVLVILTRNRASDFNIVNSVPGILFLPSQNINSLSVKKRILVGKRLYLTQH